MPVVEPLTVVLSPEFAGRAARDPDAREIRRLWQEGIESGPGRFADLDALKREARRRLTGKTAVGG